MAPKKAATAKPVQKKTTAPASKAKATNKITKPKPATKKAAKPIKAPVETVKAQPKIAKQKRADEALAAAATASKKAKPVTNPTPKQSAPKATTSTSKKITTTTKKEHATTAAKRKRTEDAVADATTATKRQRTEKKGPVINEAPIQKLNVYVCGENSSGELGLGTAKIAKEVKRPRLNALLDMNTVGVVQLECGGMHAIALTHGMHLHPAPPHFSHIC
jgi:regulator of chromosome condensation